MSIVVTAASGHLGRLVVSSLLSRGVPASDIVATSRDVSALAGLAAQGVRVRRLDYADPSTIEGALEPGDRVLLISGNDFGARVAQHGNVIRAAADARVALLAYTSAPHADTTSMQLAAEHLATERVLLDSGVPYALLRNGWYAENYAAPVTTAVDLGELVGATDDGKVSVAARADYAEAAAVVVGGLDGQGHQGSTYELGGEPAFTFAELAAELSRLTGRGVANRNVTVAELEQILVGAGLPAPMAAVFADVDRAISEGELFVDSGDLARLIGRRTTPWQESVAGFVAQPVG